MFLFREYQAIGNYVPIFIFTLVALAFGLGALLMAKAVRPDEPDSEKLSPYECGIPPLMGSRERFSIRFYIIAMLFLLFDVEAIFLYPWAVVYRKIGLYGFIEMMLFILILLVGYIYAWRKRALDWE